MIFCINVPPILDELDELDNYVSNEEYSPIQPNINKNINIMDDFV